MIALIGERPRSGVETLQQSSDLHVRGVDARGAWRAAELRAMHHHRTRRPVSLADCLLLATAAPTISWPPLI